MTQPITTVAATVGTSLLGNLRSFRNATSFTKWLEHQPAGERTYLKERKNNLTSAAMAAESGRWEDVGRTLALIPGIPRILGAELSSLLSLGGEGRYANLGTYRLIHSETEEGQGCAEAVRAYLKEKHQDIWCQLDGVPDLSHEDERLFGSGLRGLARVLAGILRECGAEHMVIDATGGYKPQIAIAVVFGQAFKVPVVYRFETFRHVIELPVLPLTLDLSMVAGNLDLLMEDNIPAEALKARLGGRPLTQTNRTFAEFRSFLGQPVRIDGSDHYPVSAFGQIMLDRWLLEPTSGDPEPPAAKDQGKISWGDHHGPSGIKIWAQKLMDTYPWIARIVPQNASGKTHVNGIFFYLLADAKSGVADIQCRYVIDNHPAVLKIKTTAMSYRQQEAALRILEREVGTNR